MAEYGSLHTTLELLIGLLRSWALLYEWAKLGLTMYAIFYFFISYFLWDYFRNIFLKIPLAPSGVLAPRSAHV